MGDYAVGTWHESHENEASWAPVFCLNWQLLSQKSLASSTIWSVLFCYAHKFLCSWMPWKGIEIVQRSPLRKNSGSMQFVEMKEVKSWSLQELSKVVATFSGLNILENRLKDQCLWCLVVFKHNFWDQCLSEGIRRASCERHSLSQSKKLFMSPSILHRPNCTKQI